jgi:hypothetical protein
MTSKEPWKELHAYWLSKHRDDRPPARGDLDPLIEITSLVPNLMLLDLENGTYRYRLVGTEVAKRSGIDMTGQLIGLRITEPGMRDQWRAALDSVRDNQGSQLLLSLMPAGATTRIVTIMLPLVDRSGQTKMILTGVFFDGHLPPGKRVPGLARLDFEG